MPYVSGISRGYALTYSSVIQLASQYNANIMFDTITKISHFYYTAGNEDYTVRFYDARGIDALTKFIPEFELQGFTTGILGFFYQLWLIINVQFEIEKNIDTDKNAIS